MGVYFRRELVGNAKRIIQISPLLPVKFHHHKTGFPVKKNHGKNLISCHGKWAKQTQVMDIENILKKLRKLESHGISHGIILCEPCTQSVQNCQ